MRNIFWAMFMLYTIIISSQEHSTNKGALMVVENEKDDVESTVEDDDDEIDEVFLPTHDWQTVKQGQGVPRGLHVRINLQTGLKEAKLMDGDSSSTYETNQQQMFNKKTVKELKEALRMLNDENLEEQVNQEADGTVNKFRTIEEIREDFKNLNISMKTEEEIIHDLLKKFVDKASTVEQQAEILMDLEYYVHKYDNAIEFSKMGGIPITMLALNSSNETLRTAAAFLMGSAMQSNPQVQVLAVDNGAMQLLLHQLAVDSSKSFQIKCLYALSCMIRQFPYAQKTFLDLGGLSVLGEFFNKPSSEAQTKLQIKAITLLYDTITEYQFATDHASTESATDKSKLLQYSQVNVKEAVKQFGWCQHIPQLLAVPDHDAKEKVFQIMSVLVDICWQSFLEYSDLIEGLEQQYNLLAFNELENNYEGEAYFSEISQLIHSMLSNIRKKHDEL